MKKYIFYAVKKLVVMLFILLAASFIIFFMMRANGIDETSVIGNAKRMTDETRQELIQKHHLDKPLVVRYGLWLKDALHGDFGRDYENNVDVKKIVAAKVPITAGLVILSISITLLIAIPVGILCAVKRNSWIDTTMSTITLLLTSVPDFLVGILIIVIVSILFPKYQFVGTYNSFLQYLSRISLPSLALAGGMLAGVARITRSSMIEQMKSNYITAVEAKGMGKVNTIFVHAFHNACLPVLTIISLMVGMMISGSVLMENIFSLPGIGSCLVTSVQKYNYPLIQFLTLIMLGVFLGISYIVDIVYMLVDPRTRK